MGFVKKIIPITSFLVLLAVLITVCSNAWVNSFRNKCYSNIDELPERKTALVLGTAKYVEKGVQNLYYQNRIDAAVELYQSGKIEFIIVSGDNGTEQYNEPITMQQDLIARGIPKNKIYLDYAGFRTLDSVERAREIFSQDSIIVVSQQFHNERAIAIASKKGIHAIGFNAQGVYGKRSFKTNLREVFARVKTVLDVTILQTKPKFYGDKIEIE